MKILVFFFFFGAYSKMERALEAHPDADMIFFLGDGLREADKLFDEYKSIPHVAVRGNCDLASSFGGESYLDEQTVDLGEIRVFACHGHKYGVKSSELGLWLRAKEKEVDLALFGHTHQPFWEQRQTLLLNPGSAADGRMALLEINNGKPRFKLLAF